MAFPSAVNTGFGAAQDNIGVEQAGLAPALAMSQLYAATAQALADAAHDAAHAQQQTNALAQAATVAGVALLYSLNPGARARAARSGA